MTGPTAARHRGASAAARLLIAATLAGALFACGDGEVDPQATASTRAARAAVSATSTSAVAAPSDAPDLLAAADSTATTSTTRPPATTSTTRPPATTGPDQATTTTAPLSDEERAIAAQRLLLAHGYDIGEIDGDIGPATMAALSDFQRTNGLAVTGALDAATFARLEANGGALSAELPGSVVVDLSEQHLHVYNAAGAHISSWPISTGAPGNETPTGSFAVQARQRVGTAKDAETVHMDYFTVFNGNIGFHGIPWVGSRDDRLWTPLGQYGVSHGCIRMEDANARYLYTFLADGAPVIVQD
ncbi:MAG: L,D-transpeptidase family protein [Acidimicrobiia bacterium]